MEKELSNITIKKASEMLESDEITSVELTKHYLERIKKYNPKINAYICILDELALKQAEESDNRRIKNQELGIMDGIPITIKDNMAMEGTITTTGSKMLENFIVPYDATVIKKIKEAGAVILGKTNMDEFAMGSSTETSHFGPTKNPWDLERVPGGSSGGSAAAVAADLCVAALGSDTGGSIRQPASLCGIIGLKPTYGTVSRYGLLAMASSLDQIGPMTKTAEDAETLLRVIAGSDELDSTSSKSEFLISKQTPNTKLQNLKLGIPKEYFAEGLDEDVKKNIEGSIETLKKQGAEIIDISLPNAKYALPCYYIIMFVEVASNLARYDGIKYGYSTNDNSQQTNNNLMETYINSRSEGFGEEVKRRIMLGTYASSAGYVDKFYAKAQKVRALVKKDFDEAFKKCDFILGPVSPTTAFKLGEKTDDPLTMYLSDIYTIAINLAGVPAMSIPAGLSNNLPVGLQIIGPQFSDAKMLELAKLIEKVRGDFKSASLS